MFLCMILRKMHDFIIVKKTHNRLKINEIQ